MQAVTQTLVQAPPLMQRFLTIYADLKIWELISNFSFVAFLQNLSSPPQTVRTPAPPVTPTTCTSGKPVENPCVNPIFTGDSPFAKRVQNGRIQEAKARIMADHPEVRCPTYGSHGDECCLSWHLKGEYYNNCGRKNDHVILFGGDSNEMVAYVQQLFPDP